MPEWLRNTFFDPEYERHRLDVHRYQSLENVRKMRCRDKLHLFEFVEQPLKSRANFENALGHVLESAISEYMSQYAVIVPGDWPAQFYTRQAVFSSCDLPINDTRSEEQQNENQQQFPILHEYARNFNHDSATIADNSMFTKPLQSAVPMIGPLHISLNAREDVMVNFHSFFKYMYENIFPHSKLAEKPKPWRTSLILEIVYGGWTLVRSQVRTKFVQCKHPLYGIFLNLLDSYIPLVLSIYSITFRSNNFTEYFLAMKFAWLMFYCFKRHHYDKAPLIWLSNIIFWRKNNHDMFNCFRDYLNISDEYGV
eukprot:Seg23.11 transcript_id=Seg23.11/GoldUCD/mRNA.D3Y31 product="hypothetical protein" protein_id=Seg23.11/GoldUCD/D3Y31